MTRTIVSRPARAASAFGLVVLAAMGPGFVAPALAGERPRAPVAAETPQPCPRQGAGFVRLPGSPTCIRLGGRAVGGADLGSHGAASVTAGSLSIDTRSESEFGPVRAFVRMGHGRP